MHSHRLVVFEIKDHQFIGKENYVVYQMIVRPKEGYGNAWRIPLRFRDFEKLNKKLSKNLLYKEKIPSFL